MKKSNYCPQCDAPLLPGAVNCKNCMWAKDGTEGNPRPILDNLKADMLDIFNTVTMDHPVHAMPRDSGQALIWFLTLVESEHRTERSTHVSGRNKHGKSWQWPYADRVKHLLHKYLVAPLDLQQLVVAAREDGIYWRGDDYLFFVCVIDETEKMRDLGLDEYRRQVRASMGRLNLAADR